MRKRKWILPGLLCGLAAAAVLLVLVLSGGGKETLPDEAPVSRCLALGCDRFVTMEETTPVNANNAREAAALMERMVPSLADCASLTCPGTADEFEQKVLSFFEDAREGDTAYLYIATHGLREDRTDGFVRAGLVISDGEREEILYPERLREILAKIPGESVLIVDACYSGGLIGKGMEGLPGNPFAGSGVRVLVSGGGDEKSYLWVPEESPEAGTGYFTASLVTALEDARIARTDTDGNGEVSLAELRDALGGLHGASRAYAYPEEDGRCLFRPVSDRSRIFGGKRLLSGLTFDESPLNPAAPAQVLTFTLREDTRLYYGRIPRKDGEWDFDEAVRLPDRERTGTVRGLLSAGVKERTVRLPAPENGEGGWSLLELATLRGDTPVLEASRLLSVPAAEGDPAPTVSCAEGFAPARGEELAAIARTARNATVTAAVENEAGETVRTLCESAPGRPEGLYLYWTGKADDGTAAPEGRYRIRVRAATGTEAREARSPYFRLGGQENGDGEAN